MRKLLFVSWPLIIPYLSEICLIKRHSHFYPLKFGSTPGLIQKYYTILHDPWIAHTLLWGSTIFQFPTFLTDWFLLRGICQCLRYWQGTSVHWTGNIQYIMSHYQDCLSLSTPDVVLYVNVQVEHEMCRRDDLVFNLCFNHVSVCFLVSTFRPFFLLAK